MSSSESSTEGVSDFVNHLPEWKPAEKESSLSLPKPYAQIKPCFVRLTPLSPMDFPCVEDEAEPTTTMDLPSAKSTFKRCSVILKKLPPEAVGGPSSSSRQSFLETTSAFPRDSLLSTSVAETLPQGSQLSPDDDGFSRQLILSDTGFSERPVCSAAESIEDVVALVHESARISMSPDHPVDSPALSASGVVSSSPPLIDMDFIANCRVYLADLTDPPVTRAHGRLTPELFALYEKWYTLTPLV